MNKKLLKSGPALAAFLILLAGCGGSGGSSGSSSRGLSMKTSDGFNGIKKNLTETAITDLAGGQLTATVEQDGRKLFLTIPTEFPTEGQTFTVGTPDVAATYEEDPSTRGLNAYGWKGTGGTVVVKNIDADGKATLELDSVVFGPDAIIDSNAASGTFKLSGSVRNAQFATAPATGGMNLTFTVVPGDEGDAVLTKFPANATIQYGASLSTPGQSLILVNTVTGVTPRRLAFLLDDSQTTGTTIDYAVEENQATAAYYQTLSGEDERGWYPISGTMTITDRTLTTITVSLSNVKFTAGGPDNGGSFVANGTITK